jgi:hypothetical protein
LTNKNRDSTEYKESFLNEQQKVEDEELVYNLALRLKIFLFKKKNKKKTLIYNLKK